MNELSLSQIEILGVKVDSLTVWQLHHHIETAVREGAHVLILNVNVYALNLAYTLPWLRDLFNRAYLVFCDGVGVMLGARILGRQVPRRITYADWMWQLAEFAEQRGISLFLLGARPGVAERCSARLRERFPNLRVVGTRHGYFDKSPGSVENAAVIAQINAAQPDVLIVGFGMPLQERWLMENWGQVQAKVALTAGAAFDYVSGRLHRPPRWMTEHGLEWLGRLLIEPTRLWRRYIIGNPQFLWRILRQRLDLWSPPQMVEERVLAGRSGRDRNRGVFRVEADSIACSGQKQEEGEPRHDGWA